jgi:3-oxoacyl-[acyl-carrier protein] reductase
MKCSLENKSALVCGSTAGIGKAIATAFAEAGCHVTLVARNEEKLRAVLEELPKNNQQTHNYLVADFSNPAELENKLQLYLDDHPAPHILVNNTGGPPGGPLSEATTQELENAFVQHVKCNQILAKACIPGMKSHGYGRIINIISTSVKQPLDGLGVSNTIRGAVANWSKTLANELGPYGITVNNILPGATATGRLDEIIQNKANKSDSDKNSVSEKMKSAVPARRFAQPEEISYAATFLASDKASYINGINLPVDGGRTKCL